MIVCTIYNKRNKIVAVAEGSDVAIAANNALGCASISKDMSWDFKRVLPVPTIWRPDNSLSDRWKRHVTKNGVRNT